MAGNNKEKIYNMLSKNILNKKKKAEEKKVKPKKTPEVSIFESNVATVAKPRNILPNTEPSKPRNISSSEGKPAVNGTSKTNGLVHKPKKKRVVDDLAGVIKEVGQKKKKSRSRKNASNTKRSKTTKGGPAKNKKGPVDTTS